MGSITSVAHVDSHSSGFTFDELLFEDNIDWDTDTRYITFTQTTFDKRVYVPRILFFDEFNSGPNKGTIYVNPDPESDDFGLDTNYGYNPKDAVSTLDAALIRAKYQSTINPVSRILILAREEEGYSAVKDLSVIELYNVNILVDLYNDDEHTGVFAGIDFIFGDSIFYQIGQIFLKGNSSLSFTRININALDNLSGNWESYPNTTMFRLQATYCFMVFTNCAINMGKVYSMYVCVDYASMLEVKFIGSAITGSQLSGHYAAFAGPSSYSLQVDCLQWSSTRYFDSLYNGGWDVAAVIRDNF